MSTTNAGASGNAAQSGQISAPVKTNNVAVFLRVNADVSGNVDVFTESGNQVNNVVDCEVELPHGDLYTSPTNAVLEFWEPAASLGSIVGAVAGSAGRSGSQVYSRLSAPSTLTSLVTDLAAIIAGGMDASAAAPFNGYSSNTNYTHFDSFGDLALAAHGHYIFGHVQATSAIDNDLALVNYFKNNTAGSAQIATALNDALQALSDSDAGAICRQVISQDPSRATGQDNTALTPNVHQGLLFATGDVVYMQVTIHQPSISSGSTSSGAPGAGSANNLPSSSAAAFPASGAQFTLKMTPQILADVKSVEKYLEAKAG